MKSQDRCQHNHQGDRCKLAVNHRGNHASNFHIWGKGTRGKVLSFAESDVPRILRKINKAAGAA